MLYFFVANYAGKFVPETVYLGWGYRSTAPPPSHLIRNFLSNPERGESE